VKETFPWQRFNTDPAIAQSAEVTKRHRSGTLTSPRAPIDPIDRGFEAWYATQRANETGPRSNEQSSDASVYNSANRGDRRLAYGTGSIEFDFDRASLNGSSQHGVPAQPVDLRRSGESGSADESIFGSLELRGSNQSVSHGSGMLKVEPYLDPRDPNPEDPSGGDVRMDEPGEGGELNPAFGAMRKSGGSGDSGLDGVFPVGHYLLRQSGESVMEGIQWDLRASAGDSIITQAILSPLKERMIQEQAESSDPAIDAADPEGRTQLVAASREGNIELVVALLARKAAVNKGHLANGWSPLCMAAFMDHSMVCEALIEAKADLDQLTQRGASPILLSCQQGHSKTPQLLLQHKCNPNTPDSSGKTALIKACERGHEGSILQLLHAQVDIDHCAPGNLTALRCACSTENAKVVGLLLAAKASVDSSYTTLGNDARQNDHWEVARQLERAGLAHQAAQNGH
jgi:ankyrin repeat protein